MVTVAQFMRGLDGVRSRSAAHRPLRSAEEKRVARCLTTLFVVGAVATVWAFGERLAVKFRTGNDWVVAEEQFAAPAANDGAVLDQTGYRLRPLEHFPIIRGRIRRP